MKLVQEDGMLTQLYIRDIVLIDRLDLEFAPGMTVLTGETGAGKSILLDALSLVLGGRGDAGLVRSGAEYGEVTAVFQPTEAHPVWSAMGQHETDHGGALILRRSQGIDGRTRAFVNDRPVSVQLMREVARQLVEIHGQHEERALIDPAGHRRLLDAYGNLTALVREVAAAFQSWQAAQDAFNEAQLAFEQARLERDYLALAHEELTLLAPEPEEEDALVSRRQFMQRAEKIASGLNDALDLFDGDGGYTARISTTLRRLERQADQDSDLFLPVIEALSQALDGAASARDTLTDALESTMFVPGELDAVEDRLFALRSAARKFSVPVHELAGYAEKIGTELEDIDSGEARSAALQRRVDSAQEHYHRLANKLSDARHHAAQRLQARVARELPPLHLENAQFSVDLSPERAGSNGMERVEFMVRSNPGTPPGSLRRIASGGELSRLILALKVALAEVGGTASLIFDEIDTAVGGAVADAIGERLRQLSDSVQLLAVTHAPQVAAKATHHFRVRKQLNAQKTQARTRLDRLDQPGRQEEIARMLAGAEITDEARAAAQRLLTKVTLANPASSALR